MIIELREDIGVKDIKNLYTQLKEKIENEPEIILDFKKVKRIDLSLIQLIMSVNRESKKRGKKIMLKSVSEIIKKQLYLGGFAK